MSERRNDRVIYLCHNKNTENVNKSYCSYSYSCVDQQKVKTSAATAKNPVNNVKNSKDS